MESNLTDCRDWRNTCFLTDSGDLNKKLSFKQFGARSVRRLHLSEAKGVNKNQRRNLHATHYPPDTTGLWGGASVCAVVCVGAGVYACVFVCLCGMAGQRNALAHAWLSCHNGPALSHCREIPLWYGGRKKGTEGRRRSWSQTLAGLRKDTLPSQKLLSLFTCIPFAFNLHQPVFLVFFLNIYLFFNCINRLPHYSGTHTQTNTHSHPAL